MKPHPSDRGKIEFFLNPADKAVLKNLCKQAGYTVAEIMRRAAEEKIVALAEKVKDDHD